MCFILGPSAANWPRDDSETASLIGGLETVGVIHVAALIQLWSRQDPQPRQR